MSLIQVKNLTFSYPSGMEDLFQDLSFQLDTDWKLGFIGRNGRGKTTFLQLLMGKHPYQGTIQTSVEFDYFPYQVEETLSVRQVMGKICSCAQDWEIQRELSCLKVDLTVLERSFATLSQGEQTKVLLAALFLNPGRFLLIDEPTNHLDDQGRELVSRYLKGKKGFILVSHDRRFLDGCVDHILAFNRKDIQVQAGNYSSWLENFERQQSFELARDQRLRREIDHLAQSARRSAAWSCRGEREKFGAGPVDRGYLGHKSAKMMKRSKSIQQRREKALEEKSALLQNVEKAEDLKLHPLPWRGGKMASFSQVAPVYDDRQICSPATFQLEAGDRLALTGGNGAGKSSILRLLAGKSLPHKGVVTLASGLVVSYLPQGTETLSGSLQEFARERELEESLFMTILRKLNFQREQFREPLESYSAGQKKKVLLAQSLSQRAHLYLWDEPLNYIDLYSRIQLEQLILEFCPTLVFVEHDREFRERVATGQVKVERLL